MRRALVLIAVAALAVPAAADGAVLGSPGTFTCNGLATFPQSAFRNPTGAERGEDDAARALRDYLRERASIGPGAPPATGWRVLVRETGVVVFHAGRPDSGDAVTLVLADGQWRPAGFGCSPWRVVPGLAFAPVRFADWAPDPRKRSVQVAVAGGGCDGDPSRRFKRLEVLETRNVVTVLAVLRPGRPIPPDAVCPAVEFVLLKTFRLDRPLGRRTVRDASTFPPQELEPGN